MELFLRYVNAELIVPVCPTRPTFGEFNSHCRVASRSRNALPTGCHLL